ncbi:MAG: hypothetical protein Tsb0021_01790 [Chlamydiales bacterium]
MERNALTHGDYPLSLRRIWQKDNFTFCIEWSDGREQSFRLSELQKSCPCAACVDEDTGKRLADPKAVDPNLKALKIENVGRYALRVSFTSGCSYGIYTFRYLREFYPINKGDQYETSFPKN